MDTLYRLSDAASWNASYRFCGVSSSVIVVGIFVLLPSVGLYSCWLGLAAVVVAAPGIVGVAVPVAWKVTNVLYEFFVGFLLLVLGIGVILDPTRRRFVFVTGVVVVFLLLFFLVSAFLVSTSIIPGVSSVILRMVGYR